MRRATQTRISTLALLAANLLPLCGVLFRGWPLSRLLALYWAETAVIGVFNIFRMLMIRPLPAVPLSLFFAFHLVVTLFRLFFRDANISIVLERFFELALGRRDIGGEVVMDRTGASSPWPLRAARTTSCFHPATNPSEACISMHPPQAR